jgi:tetratricopeptide (TPR) repeat protein
VWEPIWRGFFEISSERDLDDQIKALEKQLGEIDPNFVQRLPLIGAVFQHLPIPDSDLTQTFDAKLRKTSLESLLVDCLRARARQTPLLLVLEDMHWLDPLSSDLLEVIGRAIFDLPVLLVLVYRPLELERQQTLRVNQLPHFSEIRLTDFTDQEAEQLIELKLAQFFGSQIKAPEALMQRLRGKSQEGHDPFRKNKDDDDLHHNPFYIEELLNYIRDQNIDPHNREALDRLELPDSLHSLILSRIDQLTESQKTVLKVASVIGRLFRAAWLWGMYPDLGDPSRVKVDLEIISRYDLTPMDSPDPELTYLFKHIMTQEVAYESLPYATRAMLHGGLGDYIEGTYSSRLDQYLDLLAFHYDRSHNLAKKREYLLKAGEAAQEEDANIAAKDYYYRALPLLADSEKVSILLKLGQVLDRISEWTEALELYEQALTIVDRLDDQEEARPWVYTAMGEVLRKQGEYDRASLCFDQAKAGFKALDNQVGIGQVLHESGTLAAYQGDLDAARAHFEESLAIRQQLGDKPKIASLLSNLGLVAQYQGDHDRAYDLYQQSLVIRWEVGAKWAIAISLNNLGYLLIDRGDYSKAQAQLEEALQLQREIGDRWAIANALNNLGNAVRAQGRYSRARTLYEEALTINRDLGDKTAIAYLLEDIGGLAALEGEAVRALHLTGAAQSVREEIGSPLPPAEQVKLDRMLESARQALGPEQIEAVMAEGQAWSLETAIDYALGID